MNEQNYRPFWDEVLRLLREEYKEKGLEEEFTLWFNMEYVKDNLNEITVSVPSKFMWTQLIQKGYVKAVQDKILELTGHSVNITYIAKSPLPKVAEPINTSPTLQFKETDNLLAKESVPKKEIFLEKKQHPQLDENYTFDTFIPGENSEFAYRVAQAAAKEPGFKNYNPLLIYGGVGLGKTHLMQSIGNYIYKQNGGNVKICCVTAEEFTNEFIASIGNKQNIEKFKSKYRKLDVLLVDDIHFFIGKDSTQEELFHTFEALQQKHAQMVFTCDRPITELKELLKRLSSRLSSGTTVDLKLPDYETRIAILKNEISLLGKKQIIPQEIDFFQLVKRKIAKTMGDDKTAILLQELYKWYRDNEKWDIAISLLKEILSVDQKDIWARKAIIECYRGKYAKHSHLEDYIRSSNLSQNFRNVFEAINDFEKHIAFDVNSFVYHRAWGVGIIKKVENDTLTVDFGKKVGIKDNISLKMAVSALTPLSKNHIWVLKAKNYVKVKGEKVPLAKKIKEDKEWALRTIIKSFGNSCDFKKIKAELVPSILKDSEWTSWNTAAKKILESNSTFGVNPNDISQYIVREHAISIEEKLANEFKAQKSFFARIDILMKYLNSDETDKTSELFAEMFNYFAAFIKTFDSSDGTIKVTEQIVASYLVVQTVTAQCKLLSNPSKTTFQSIYDKIDDPREMYELLKDTKNTTLRRDFLLAVKMLPNWSDEYIRLFPTVLSGDMIKILVDNGYAEKVQKLAVACFENCRDYRNAVLFLFEHCQNEEWFKASGINYERQLITLIQLIELTFREINNHVNSTENKKINKNATDLLFANDALVNYMFQNDEQTVNRMYTLINDLADIDPSYKAQLRTKIMEHYPNFKFHVTEEKASQPKGMLVTAKKLEEKKALLEKIQSVDIPENAKEISEARAQGDLKENAEYKAAKEHQHWLNEQATKLQGELNRAVIFDPTTITTAIVSFATVVTLHNEDTNKDEVYTILGPWESDPDNNIVSYMAPFGNAIMDKKPGEKASFTINEHKYNYTVKTIKAAQL